MIADFAEDYPKAAKHYVMALKLVPPQDESSIIDIDARLAADYVHLNRVKDAEPLVKHLLEFAPKLKATNRMDPELLVNTKYLVEAYESLCPRNLPWPERRQRFAENFDIRLQLLDFLALNEAQAIATRFDQERGLVGFGYPEKVERDLQKLTARMKNSSMQYEHIRLCLAALQWQLHKPQLLNQLSAALRQHHSEVSVLSKIADAHFWACNYDEAAKLLDQASSIVAKKKPRDTNEELSIIRQSIAVQLDRGNYKAAEPYMRHRLAINSGSKTSGAYLDALKDLISCLRQQNKVKEADALEKTNPKPSAKNYDWMIEDEKKRK